MNWQVNTPYGVRQRGMRWNAPLAEHGSRVWSVAFRALTRSDGVEAERASSGQLGWRFWAFRDAGCIVGQRLHRCGTFVKNPRQCLEPNFY